MKFSCVLAIDDDSVSHFLNLKILKKLINCEHVQETMNGKEALTYIEEYAKASNQSPDLILLDWRMPVMDGKEFLEKYFQKDFANKETVQIIVLTTSEHERDKKVVAAYPGVKYIIKPLTAQKILEALNSHKNL